MSPLKKFSNAPKKRSLQPPPVIFFHLTLHENGTLPANAHAEARIHSCVTPEAEHSEAPALAKLFPPSSRSNLARHTTEQEADHGPASSAAARAFHRAHQVHPVRLPVRPPGAPASQNPAQPKHIRTAPTVPLPPPQNRHTQRVGACAQKHHVDAHTFLVVKACTI